MKKKLLVKIYNLARDKNKPLLIIMAFITIIMAAFIPNLKIVSSQRDLIGKNDPVQKRYNAYMKEFGAADNLIVVLEGNFTLLKASVEDFATEILKEKKYVRTMFYKTDTSFFLNRAPLFVSKKNLQKALHIAKKQHNIINKFTSINSLYSLLDNLNGAFSDKKVNIDPSIADDLIGGIDVFLGEWDLWMSDITHNRIDLLNKIFLSDSEVEGTLKSEGYLFSKDYQIRCCLEKLSL